jgi:hypothetical protein
MVNLITFMKKINFYPFSEETLVIAPKPEVSSKFLPDWYKKTPPVINNGGISFGMLGTTVKKCSPVREICSATDWCQVSFGWGYSTSAIRIIT